MKYERNPLAFFLKMLKIINFKFRKPRVYTNNKQKKKIFKVDLKFSYLNTQLFPYYKYF